MNQVPYPDRGLHPLARDAALSYTLPGYLYSDAAVFEAEKANVFYDTWQIVGHGTQFANRGQYSCVEIADQEVFIIRGEDDVLRGFYNVCPHRGHPLLTGIGTLRANVTCPYHAWAFAPSGRLVSARLAKSMPGFHNDDFGLVPIAVEEVMGMVFANLEAQAEPVSRIAAGMFEDIRAHCPWWDDLTEAEVWSGDELRANWKVLAENCLECYHCAPNHPGLCDLLDVSGYQMETHATWMRSYAPLNKHRNVAYDVDPDEPVQEFFYWHLFPSVGIGVYPGAASAVVYRANPQSPHLSMLSGVFMNRKGEQLAEDRVEFRTKIFWPEDKLICESVHRGLQSRGYRQGRFVVNPDRRDADESAVHHFQRLYAERMGLCADG